MFTREKWNMENIGLIIYLRTKKDIHKILKIKKRCVKTFSIFYKRNADSYKFNSKIIMHLKSLQN